MPVKLQGSVLPHRTDNIAHSKEGVFWQTEWNGDEVGRRVLLAVREGVDEVVDDCVKDAKPEVPWWTGQLSASLQVTDRGYSDNKVYAEWGSELDYAFYVETRDPSTLPDIVQDNVPPPVGEPRNTGRRFVLRRTADRNYPKLPVAIQGKLK